MKVIYLDLDGCLVDFIAGVCDTFGMTRYTLEACWPVGDWDVHKALGLSESDFWGQIDRHGAGFWERLNWTPDGRDILAVCEATGLPVVIMTSPPLNPAAAAGKVAWIRRELPRYRRRFAVTPCKEAFAHPGAFLVDDSDANAAKFMMAGGNAILLPRRWNTLHALEPLPALRAALRAMVGEPG